MNSDILDDELIERKAPVRKWPRYLALGLLWFGVVLSIRYRMLYELRFVFALFFLGVSTVFIFRNLVLGIRLVFVTIVLGIFNLVVFFPFGYTFYLGFGDLAVGIEVLCLIVGIIHFRANRLVLEDFLCAIIDYFRSGNMESSGQLLQFQMRFKDRTEAELIAIVKDDKRTAVAKRAAQELLDAREQNAKRK